MPNLRNYLIKITAGVLFCLCPLVFFMPRGAVIVLAFGGLLGWFKEGRHCLSLLKAPFSLTLIGLILWISLSSLWAPIPTDTLCLAARLTGLLVLGMGWTSLLQSYSASDLLVLKKGLLYGIILTIILIATDVCLGKVWQNYCQKSSAKAFVPLALSLSIAIWFCINFIDEKVKSILILMGVVGVLITIDCDTAVIAVICGIIASLIYFLFPKLTYKSVKFGALFLILGLPWIFTNCITDSSIKEFNQSVRSFSYVHRLYIWQFVSHKITEKSLIGRGGDSSRAALIGGEKREWPIINKNGEVVTIHSKAIPLHPHNLPLQIWLELGVIGALIVSALSYLLLREIDRYQSKDTAALIGCFTAVSFTFLVNLGCWQSWWLATLVIIFPLLYYVANKSAYKKDILC